MAGDTFGELFSVTTWGESHGPAMGALITGTPPLLKFNCKEEKLELALSLGRKVKMSVLTCPEIQEDLDRRRPGQSKITTPRGEADIVYLLSGIFENRSTGTPISALCINRDSHSQDYDNFKYVDRPGHAGYTYRNKYGIYDHRGGGRSSYRETWGRVVAGAIARKFLKKTFGTEIVAYVESVSHISAVIGFDQLNRKVVDAHPTRCPDRKTAELMSEEIEKAMTQGDSLGGVVGVLVRNVPPGLGEPVFDKVDADLFKALKSIHATKAVEIGMGARAATLKGSEHNDLFEVDSSGKVRPRTNNAGGVLGGITTGEDLHLRVTFKPTATVRKPQKTVSIKGKSTTLIGEGRHDPCVLPRAVPTVEAMIAIVLADHCMRLQAQCGWIKR